MKIKILVLGIIFLNCNCCDSQQGINALIEKNLQSRYTNVEIVSIEPDSCPDLRGLFNLSLNIKVVASECKLNIAKTTSQYYQGTYSFDQVSSLCEKEIEKIKELKDYWQKMYFTNNTSCMLVKYRYGNADGIKTTMEEYYSTDPVRYQEGNYPYLNSELTDDFGLKYYLDVTGAYKEFLLEFLNN